MKLWNVGNVIARWITENAILILTGYFISELYTWRQWQMYAAILGVGFLLAVHDAYIKQRMKEKQ